MKKDDKQKVVNRLLGKRVCPECNKKIDELGYSEYQQRIMDFGVDDKGNAYYGNSESLDDFLNPDWYCRECNHTICKTEEDAIEFLKREG